jgi:hypothetical protein
VLSIPAPDPDLKIHIYSENLVIVPSVVSFKTGNTATVEIIPYSKSPALIVFTMIAGNEYVPLKPLEVIPQVPILGIAARQGNIWKKYMFEFGNDEEFDMWRHEIQRGVQKYALLEEDEEKDRLFDSEE